MMSKERIIHLITPYLFHTGSWVYSQINGATSFAHYVFTQRTENLEQFPHKEVYSIDKLNFIKRLVNKFYVHCTDRYGLFFSHTLRDLGPKLFHAHMGFEAVRWYHFVKDSGIPLITSFYGQDVSKLGKIPYWHERYQPLFKYGEKFLTEGGNLKRQLVDLGCPEHKVVIQHLGVDVKTYPEKIYGKSDKAKVTILQVSTFVEKKGIEYSLEAVAHLKRSYGNFEYRLIGGRDDQSESRIRRKIEELNIQDKVSLLGIVKHKEMLLEMANADIFLHPSVVAADGDNEGGSPVGITEASAIGIPIVSTFHADIPEVVLNGKTGLLVPERNSEMIAEKLALLIENSDLRMQYGLAGREHISKNYNLDIQMKKLENIYKLMV